MEALAAWLSGQAAAAGAAASALVTQYVVAPAQTLVQQGDLAIQQIQQLAASFQSYADKGGGSSGGENSGSPDPNDPHSKETATRNNKAAEAANSPSNQRAIQWLEEDTQKVEHIMAQKHAWNRLVNLSGNAAEDYRAIQPYLEEVMSTEGKQINTSTLGPVMEFVKTINSQQIFVHAVQLSDGVLKVSDAWVATVTR
jgi:hypothetical protein